MISGNVEGLKEAVFDELGEDVGAEITGRTIGANEGLVVDFC